MSMQEILSALRFKDMDLDLDHFLNLEQLITGEFTDIMTYIF